MGIYIVLDGNRDADYVLHRGRTGRNSSDCRNTSGFVPVIFLLSVKGTKKEPSSDGPYICLLSSLNFSRSEAGSTNI